MSSSWRKSVAEKTRDTFAAPILLLACSETISRRNVNTWRRMSNLAWDSAANLSLKMSTRAFRDPFENCASSSAFQVCEGRSGGSMWIRVCFSVPATVWICSSSWQQNRLGQTRTSPRARRQAEFTRSTLTVAPSPIEASSASFGVSVFIRTSEPAQACISAVRWQAKVKEERERTTDSENPFLFQTVFLFQPVCASPNDPGAGATLSASRAANDTEDRTEAAAAPESKLQSQRFHVVCILPPSPVPSLPFIHVSCLPVASQLRINQIEFSVKGSDVKGRFRYPY